MAVSPIINDTHVTASDALTSAKNRTAEGTIGYTERGTAVVESNTTMGQNSFLKLLVAQMKNLDPSQDQDPTAYITQMAEFASIEQLNNLNTSISDFANQQKVGQVAMINEYDSEGNYKWGLVTQIFKQGSTTYAKVQDISTGEFAIYDIKKIIGTSDSGYSSANFETALNSKFLSANTLAKDNANAVVIEKITQDMKDKNGDYIKDDKGNNVKEEKIVTHKVQITGAYLDKQNSQVKVQVVMLDENGNPTDEKKEYDYDSIASAGKLDNDALNEIIKNINENSSAKAKVSTSASSNLNDAVNQVTTSNQNTNSTELSNNTESTSNQQAAQAQKDLKIAQRLAGN